MSQDNGWGEYSRLVLKELETLATGIESLRQELAEVKQELAAMRVREDKVDELKAWTEKNLKLKELKQMFCWLKQ